jgi:hypothetical protein
MKHIIILTVALLLCAATIPIDRWMVWMEQGDQLIYYDEQRTVRQLTFIDAFHNGFNNACRLHESEYDIETDEYGAPLRRGKPAWSVNYFEEMNWTPDTYQIYHGAMVGREGLLSLHCLLC